MAAKDKFLEIELPLIKEKANLLGSEKQLEEKTIKIDLSRKLKGKGMEIIYKIKNGKAEIKRLHLLGYFIRRMMKNSVSYVEDSFSLECKDGKIKVKPFLITRQKVSRKVRKGLREETRKEIQENMEKKKFQEIISDLLSNKFQKNLALKLKKIYPLSLCEIRDVYIDKI